MWDTRYAEDGYAYGTAPNDYLVEALKSCPGFTHGKALCLAEGEGRNAVYLAKLGFEVTAVDQSSVGLEKAKVFAKEQMASLETITADLSQWDLGEEKWDLIVSIWAHLPRSARMVLHQRIVKALRPGGYFILEAYRPENVGRGVGGPQNTEMTMSLTDLKSELSGLTFLQAHEIEREVHEGKYHNGQSAVVQLLLQKAP